MRPTILPSVVIVAMVLSLAAWGGGGSGNPTTTTTTSTTTTTTTTSTSGAAFSGFDFALNSGDFWEFRWDYYMNSWAQGSGGSTKTDAGRFWLVLGAADQIQGITAYEVTLYGKSKTANKAFGPRWKYLAMNGNRLMGSTDGTSLATIFDAQAGKWPGGGFFTSLPNSKLVLAQNGTITSNNTYISGAAIVVGQSASESQCQYFPGIGTICGDSSYNFTENEYFRGNQGPVGYYYYNTFSDCGGGFCSGATWRHNVGLTASTRTGQSNPLVQGLQSANNASTAVGISTANPVMGRIWSTSIVSSNVTQITVTIVDDNGVTHSNYQTYVEHWYSFSLPSTTTVTLTLSFEGSPSDTDLDMFLVNAGMTTLYSYSVHDNPVSKDQHEKITVNLPAGTYRIGVDHAGPVPVYPSNSPAVRYTLVRE